MQNVSFKDIDDFLDFLSGEELKIVKVLRATIFNLIPHIDEKLSYNVPFYKKNKGMFFIWPASVLWGRKQTYEGVRLGFQQGTLMNDELNYLDRGNRKQVYYKTYKNVEEIDLDILKTYIFEAVFIDDNFKRD